MKRTGLWALLCTLLIGSCSVMTPLDPDLSAQDKAMSGTNGTLEITGMSNNAMTVTWKAAGAVTFARLYVSEGTRSGLVLASRDMTYQSGG